MDSIPVMRSKREAKYKSKSLFSDTLLFNPQQRSARQAVHGEYMCVFSKH